MVEANSSSVDPLYLQIVYEKCERLGFHRIVHSLSHERIPTSGGMTTLILFQYLEIRVLHKGEMQLNSGAEERSIIASERLKPHTLRRPAFSLAEEINIIAFERLKPAYH